MTDRIGLTALTIATAACLIFVGSESAQAQAVRCPDLTGNYSCPGCDAISIAKNVYQISNGAGHTTMVPVEDNVHGWVVLPGAGWAGGPAVVSDDCKTIDFGGGPAGIWKWISGK
jgi:hypothetical protein